MVLTPPCAINLFAYRTIVRYSTLPTTITGGARASKPTLSTLIASEPKDPVSRSARCIASSLRASP
jgi:hypothetical protein